MTNDIAKLQDAAMTGEIADDENPLFIFSNVSTSLLKAIVDGEIDIVKFARHELLANR